MAAVVCFVIVATPAHDALVSIALYSVVASAFLDAQPISVMCQALHYMIRNILPCNFINETARFQQVLQLICLQPPRLCPVLQVTMEFADKVHSVWNV